MLFLLAIYGSCLTRLSDVLRLHAGNEENMSFLLLLHISVSSDNWLNYLRCPDPVMLSLI